MKIGFTGPFSDNNLGDYAMLVNDVKEVCTITGKIEEIILFTYNSQFIRKIVDSYLKNYPVKVIEIQVMDNLHYAPRKSKDFEIEYEKRCMLPQEICDSIKNIEELKHYICDLDIVILSGGGCMNYYWMAKHRLEKMVSILAPLILARRENKKLITLGNTFGPWGECKDFFELIFQYLNFEHICVRDDLESISAVAQVGQTNKLVSVIDDLYFLDNSLKKEKRIYEKHFIVLELYLSLAELENQLENIRAVVQNAKEQGLQVVFLAFGKEYGGEFQGEYLKQNIPELILFQRGDFLKIEEAWNLIKYAEYVICDRYHSLVLAVAAETPCLMYLREINGNRKYYFNKGYGVLKKVFGDGAFDESDFLVSDLDKFFHTCIKNKIKDIQKSYVVEPERIKMLKELRNYEIKKMLDI